MLKEIKIYYNDTKVEGEHLPLKTKRTRTTKETRLMTELRNKGKKINFPNNDVIAAMRNKVLRSKQRTLA